MSVPGPDLRAASLLLMLYRRGGAASVSPYSIAAEVDACVGDVNLMVRSLELSGFVTVYGESGWTGCARKRFRLALTPEGARELRRVAGYRAMAGIGGIR